MRHFILKSLILVFLTFNCIAFGKSICDSEIVKDAVKITANGPVQTKDGLLREVSCEYSTLIYDFLFNDEMAEIFSQDMTPEKTKESKDLLQNMLNFMYCDETGFANHFKKESIPMIFKYSTPQQNDLFVIRADKFSCKKKIR